MCICFSNTVVDAHVPVVPVVLPQDIARFRLPPLYIVMLLWVETLLSIPDGGSALRVMPMIARASLLMNAINMRHMMHTTCLIQRRLPINVRYPACYHRMHGSLLRLAAPLLPALRAFCLHCMHHQDYRRHYQHRRRQRHQHSCALTANLYWRLPSWETLATLWT